MIIGKDGYLQPCDIVIQVKQEVNGGKGVSDLGNVVIDLSECINPVKSNSTSSSVTRKYLLQQAKVNSAIRVTIKADIIKGQENTFNVRDAAKLDSSIDGLKNLLNDSRRGSAVPPTDISKNSDSNSDQPASRLATITGMSSRLANNDDSQTDFVNKLFQSTRNGQ